MPSRSDFHHLHLHSEYSLLDGAVQASELADLLVETGMRGCAVTDHGSLFGAIEFHDELVKRDLRPIIGMEAYISPTPISERDAGGRGSRYNHLTLLAMDEEGYRNLCRLSSIGYLEGFYFKPRIDREVLSRHCGGLAIGSACLRGEIAERVLAGDESGAREAVGFYHDLVGRDRFFIELMDHGLADEKAVLPGLAKLAAETGALPVATNDAHYLRREHAYAHEVLLCLQTNRKMDDPGRMRFGTPEFYVKTPLEMETLFDWIPESVANTARIAELCSFSFEKGEIQLPAFPIPEGADMASVLRENAFSGLSRRLGRDLSPEETERLSTELQVIEDMGFPGYFLIVAELRRWAASQGIATGPGRGSAAGSLVSYATGITDVNPLVHGLNFSRFLNPARREMPDIDLDFCVERRQEVIEHIVAMYGRSNVSQIVTFNRMKAKSVIRDVVRALGLPFELGDRLSRMAAKENDPNASLEEIMEAVPQIAQSASSDETVAKVIDLCKVLENHVKNTSVHAAGVIIAPGDLLDFVPLYQSKNEIMTQYEMRSLDRAGLMKLDVLGLRTVTVLQKAERMVVESGCDDFSLDSIPLDDPETLALIRSGETTGVFQLEGSGMREALRKIGVNRFEDVTAAVAIFRPGSMHMIDTYAQNKQGMEAGNGFRISYLHPELEDVLSETYGVMIYQEQVMAIAHRLSGMTMSEADVFRKAISKKNAAIMARQRDRFVEGATGRGIHKKTAVDILDQIEKFAEYGFNKSHAVSYALLAFRTAYMKAHHPARFMEALLSSWIGTIDQISIVAEDCRRMGVTLLPPSVCEGGVSFGVNPEGSIVYALSAVRNVGEGPAAEIMRAREEGGPFRDLFDFASRVDSSTVNRRVYESLAGAGAFDCLEPSRARVMAGIETVMEYGARARQMREAGQMSLFGGSASPEALPEPSLPDEPEMTIPTRLNLEKSSLGFYFSGHPMDEYSEDIAAFTDFEPGEAMPARGRARTAGVVTSVKEIPSRSGPIAFVTLEGRTGSCEVIVFSDILQKIRQLLEPGSFILVEGEITDRREENRLSVSGAVLIEKARRQLKAGLVLRFSASGCDAPLREKVAGRISECPGNGPVKLEIVFSTGRVMTAESRSVRVEPTDRLLADLRSLLGVDAVRLAPGVRSLN
ncbi:MAG: DNA polymerase III subunit alpha [Candidatus Fermentibacter sp.]|nr:DNA polymerase III subunit alpha [Candidatus Fermentibacter sp.]